MACAVAWDLCLLGLSKPQKKRPSDKDQPLIIYFRFMYDLFLKLPPQHSLRFILLTFTPPKITRYCNHQHKHHDPSPYTPRSCRRRIPRFNLDRLLMYRHRVGMVCFCLQFGMRLALRSKFRMFCLHPHQGALLSHGAVNTPFHRNTVKADPKLLPERVVIQHLLPLVLRHGDGFDGFAFAVASRNKNQDDHHHLKVQHIPFLRRSRDRPCWRNVCVHISLHWDIVF